MTQRATGCLDGSHNHVVVIERESRGGERFLTVWLCPVLRTLGAMWEDYSRKPVIGNGGPLSEGPLA